MAAIVVETGSGTNPAANSYVSEAELTTYATDRGITLVDDESVLLIKAMDYLEGLPFIGRKATESQPLQWPRRGVRIDGYPVDSDEIPTLLKKSQMEVAISIDQNMDPSAPIQRGIKREKVDTLEVEYMDGAASFVINPKIFQSLSKLLGGSGIGYNIIKVSRG